MDRTKNPAQMTPREFRQFVLDGRREALRTAPTFQCTACRMWKDRKDAEDAHVWKVRPGPLADKPLKGVPTYVLCQECADKDPDIVYRRVTASFVEAGLFGDTPTEVGKSLLGGA